MRAVLIGSSGLVLGREYALDAPVVTIGRRDENAIVIKDPTVSRKHAELRRNTNGDWTVVDLGSTNGVKVNGRQVDSARLSPGDQVQMGTTYFTFDIEH